jgi:glutamyl-Q tRNA(Asp) synthetase
MIRPRLDTVLVARHAPLVTRFAPSPTGFLHLGHVVNAIYVWGIAQALDATVIIRIEDHDRIRSRPEYDAALLEDLRWLGFLDLPVTSSLCRQSARGPLYEDALARLRTVGHVYACDCSRSSYPGERYPGICRDRGLQEQAGCSVRLRIDPGPEPAHDLLLGPLEQSPDSQCGDLLVKDRDNHWTYQFAVTVDDLEQGIGLVVRGQDLVASTGRQIRLGKLLRSAGMGDRPWPPLYAHHSLILDDHGLKLSKSTGATGVRQLRAAGRSPADVIGEAAAAVGLLRVAGPISATDVSHLLMP